MRLQIIGAMYGAALAAVGCFGADTVRAQVEEGRSFEVASVRLTAPQTRASRRVTNTRVDMANISLRILLLRAFEIDEPSRLSAPDWVAGVNVDIHAALPEGSGREHVPEMLKTLLMTRFGLRAHAEPRPTDVYELVVSSGGERMQEVQAVDELDVVFPADPSQKAPPLDMTSDSIEGRVRSISTSRGLIIIDKRSRYERIRTDRGTEEIDAERIAMGQLASLLSFTVDRPVVDRTNLTGLYQFRIELPLPTFAEVGNLGSSRTPDAATASEPNRGSPFRAVEQLGLKLERGRIPLDTIVVDHIDRAPKDN